MNERYYIAYGSNLNLGQMKDRCPDARVVGTAQLDGYELLFKGSKTGSYLTIEKKAGSSVPVAVWAVSEADERKLDRYEGYPGFYYKKELRIPVTDIETGKVRNLWSFVYIMHEERPIGTPSLWYLATCCEGYRDFGFNHDTLADAYAMSEEAAR